MESVNPQARATEPMVRVRPTGEARVDLPCSLGWIAAARGDDERTRAYGTAVEQWAHPRDSGLHLALSAMALVEAAPALPGVERWPFDHARVRPAFGALHRRRRRPGDGRPELRRAAGVTTERTPDGAGAPLTAQQLEVARLAASGLSNKEIGARLYPSPRTVGAHLYRIFPKLGITSRSALRDALDSLRRTGKEGTMTSAHTRPGR
ncbi:MULTISPECIES: helix-turn-helix transcriptional regulator [unclassified Streptomyces]|uniref:helix-turn-helix transcriptional regulator n=1 Tax=unclassified Streptomyces TaxID=2593676 RepID=UPI002E80FE60|nr:helix-turn-helix transcriptional regulator [Streptomyces sp. NBC_00589]WTI42910.1 helix-turn-helix transcriptional regulator [Streptomyces sp. NBC_00775]WUB32877.1 helix-turn-helix transcriptional regulator [Streptomyces sp. NBC_00589]